MIRIAAVGDVHAGDAPSPEWVAGCARLAAESDVLLFAGDLTQHGALREAEALVAPLKGAGVPVVAILGNHDYNMDQHVAMRRMMEKAGICVLEGEATTLDIGGTRVGIAGTKGFGGGFSGASASAFGEDAMKAFVGVTRRSADLLGECLAKLSCDIRVALTHYSPARDTLAGEKLEIYPFLGSYLLGAVIDDNNVQLAIHGHAHKGSERGITPGGTPVRNVAMPVLNAPFSVYDFGDADDSPAK
ncbi:MAG TPA: metallophosphoesterase [Polyangia bacterium]|nr:metallophosphoesterase [Polyangia bacterium]